MADTKTPLYCAVCGTRLTDNSSSITTGFDVYTGERLTSESRYLSCPNPTVVANFLVKRTTYHPTWRLSDGVWTS